MNTDIAYWAPYMDVPKSTSETKFDTSKCNKNVKQLQVFQLGKPIYFGKIAGTDLAYILLNQEVYEEKKS